MTYHEQLLAQFEPLESHEKTALREWLATIREDIHFFGDTPEDNVRIAQIEARLGQ